jgi:hypothetical protein
MPALHAAAVFVMGVAGTILLVRLLAREWQRVNAELDRVRAVRVRRSERASFPTLRRDPETGEYRPQR